MSFFSISARDMGWISASFWSSWLASCNAVVKRACRNLFSWRAHRHQTSHFSFQFPHVSGKVISQQQLSAFAAETRCRTGALSCVGPQKMIRQHHNICFTLAQRRDFQGNSGQSGNTGLPGSDAAQPRSQDHG